MMVMEKAIALLSGGIDSPVAISLMQNRVEVIAIHFHQVPLTTETEIEKVKKLARLLGVMKTYLIPFTAVFTELVTKGNHRDYFILSKIAMMRAAEIIAVKECAKYLITGENLAQVSSQTLSNLTTITSCVGMPILRPVLAYDKQEIIDKAKKIGTYETSKGPEICCLLGPKDPATWSSKKAIEEQLEKINLREIIEKALSQAEVMELSNAKQ